MPTASLIHFLVKLSLAAPDSFLSEACWSHAAAASFWHLVMKLVSAAPASFLSPACAVQEFVCGSGAERDQTARHGNDDRECAHLGSLGSTKSGSSTRAE